MAFPNITHHLSIAKSTGVFLVFLQLVLLAALDTMRHSLFLDFSIPEACAHSLSPIDFSWISLLPSVICGMLPKNRCSPKFGLSSFLLIL